ncbi:MAG: hypothetical protein EXQ52_01185 [Bryobacterales bacterium]|nr:hypothetical protein [Bryobacterales bacterium]
MPLNALRPIRKMRGGAQAHLIEADDSHFYIVKFQNNPQHRRILVNELLASCFLRHLQISAPEHAIIDIGEDFLREYPEVAIELGTRKIQPLPGWHFGSRHPGDPSRLAVYDFVPDTLLGQVQNIIEFRGALVFDKWTANADGRQSVFFRARLRDRAGGSEVHPLKLGFVALMVDQGFIFDGPHWDFPDSPVQGLYPRKLVYSQIRGLKDFEPWLDQVVHFPDDVIDKARRQVPPQWVVGDEDELDRVLETLMKRRKRVPALLNDVRRARVNPFPEWT